MELHGTTIICVRKKDKVVMAGDGQVSMGSTILKSNAKKLRQISQGVIAGFAGSTSDAITLFEDIQNRVKQAGTGVNLERVCIAIGREMRLKRSHKEAMLLVANSEQTLLVTGMGDVIAPEHDVIAIGSGGAYAESAALALMKSEEYGAEKIARLAMEIASEKCVYTNNTLTVLTIGEESTSHEAHTGETAPAEPDEEPQTKRQKKHIEN